MQRHFAFVAPPKPGHVYPTLPLVEKLVARGHRVTYVTGDPMLPAVAATGADAIELPGEDLLRPDQAGDKSFEFTIDEFAGLMLTMINQTRQEFPTVFERLQQLKPDAVCYDTLSPLGAWVAEKLQVPGVALIPTMADNEHFTMGSRIPAGQGGARGRTPAELFGEVAAATADARHALGIEGPPKPIPMLGGQARLNLVSIPREFQIAGDTFDESFRFLGPSTGSRAQATGWTPPADGSPVLYISLGTVFNNRPDFFAHCVEAFRDSRWHVVMVVGESTELPQLPDNFEVAPFFPQLVVLSHAKVFVCHTGMNSTMEGLYYGVPLVSVPQMPEQAVNGTRAAELGLARVLDAGSITPQLLRETVEEVSADPAIRVNVAKFSKRLRSTDGASSGAEALEKMLAENELTVAGRGR